MLLAGTASDQVFVADVFEQPLAAWGIRLVAPPPTPGHGVVSAMMAALDAAPPGPGLLVGGVSLGAHAAARWAVRHPARIGGLLLAMPAWLGQPGPAAPAAAAARASATALRKAGLSATLDQVRATAAPWLADELERAWLGYGDQLAATLETAAATAAPTARQLRALTVPVGIATAADDPVHPRSIARSWCEALPNAALVVTTLKAIGADRTTLGRAVLLAWLRAAADYQQPRRHQVS